jgi:hypothetical protein
MDLHPAMAWTSTRLGIRRRIRCAVWPRETAEKIVLDLEEIRHALEALNARRAADDAPPDPAAGLQRMVGAMKQATNLVGCQGVETAGGVAPPWPPSVAVACVGPTAIRNHQTQ